MQSHVHMEEVWSPGTTDFMTALWKCVTIGVWVEVGNNLTPSHSKTRPADILIPNWVMARTAALDVSVTSPLNPQTLLEVGVTATAAAHQTTLSVLSWVGCAFLQWGKDSHPEQQT